jgi:hypothetical protein
MNPPSSDGNRGKAPPDSEIEGVPEEPKGFKTPSAPAEPSAIQWTSRVTYETGPRAPILPPSVVHLALIGGE